MNKVKIVKIILFFLIYGVLVFAIFKQAKSY